jgi:RHS repeat-associated protein
MLGAVWRRLAVIAATVLVVLMTSSSLASARNAGRPTSEVQDFAYDAASRLLAKTSSNVASKAHVGAYRYGEGAGSHAVTAAGSEALAYDAGGFMSERRGTGGSTWAYAWDGRGRLAQVSRDAAVVQTSSYDSAGVRVVKREGASTTLYLAPDFEVRDGLATTYVKAGHTSVARVEEPAFATTFYPDLAPLAGSAGSSAAPDGLITAADAWVAQAAKSGLVDLPPPAAAKAKTADVDKMLASAARRILGADATQTTYIAHDHLGSPSLETSERGEVVARRWHGPYGEVRGATGAWAEARGFTGKERDETTGLADHGARYLDTRLGRWTAPDPLAVRELGGAELDVYGYVEGRVTSEHDPDGTAANIGIGAFVGAFVSAAVEGKRQYDSKKFDATSLGVSLLEGAATGAMGGATFGASLGVQATVMGATTAYTGTMKRVMRGEQLSLGTLAADAVPGAAPALARIAAPVARNIAYKLLGTYASLARAATINPTATEVILGKYNQGGVSYVKVAAERRATFFQIDNWEKTVESVGGEKNIWNINKEFLKQQDQAGKAFVLSHEPSQATGYFKQEVEQLGEMGYRFVQDGALWRGVK